MLLRQLIPFVVFAVGCSGCLDAGAQQYRLKYQPSGVIVDFYLDSTHFYTDTTALIRIYQQGGHYDCRMRVIKTIRALARAASNDTILVTAKEVAMEMSADPRENFGWITSWAILNLIREGKIAILDKSGYWVKRLQEQAIEVTEKDLLLLFTNRHCGERVFGYKTIYYAPVNTTPELRYFRRW